MEGKQWKAKDGGVMMSDLDDEQLDAIREELDEWGEVSDGVVDVLLAEVRRLRDRVATLDRLHRHALDQRDDARNELRDTCDWVATLEGGIREHRDEWPSRIGDPTPHDERLHALVDAHDQERPLYSSLEGSEGGEDDR
jgi:hypothetical protein